MHHFQKNAIDRSVTRLIRVDSHVPEFEEGYNDWRTHCGGVYTVTVAEMVEVDEKTFNSQICLQRAISSCF